MSFAKSISHDESRSAEDLASLLIPLQSDLEIIEATLRELIGSQVPFVKSVAEYILANGGKRLRPILTLLSAKLCGHSGPDVFKMGATIEFIHTASLLHDDVIDNAKMRRGQVSANAKWGNHVSVLVGDFFYCRASQLLTEQKNLKILKVVTDCITALTEGEVLEIVTNADLNTTVEDYLQIVKNKTALLFAVACQVGGILAGVNDSLQSALYEYGYNLGMAFQLTDDVMDYLSDTVSMGKNKGVDLKEGKLTMPLIFALNQATADEVQQIKSCLLGNASAEELQKISQIIQSHGGFALTNQRARQFVFKAQQALSIFKSSLEKDLLQNLATSVVGRSS